MEKPKRAIPFIQTRKHHTLETAEDYTEMISELIEKNGEARTCEIAKQMGVSHVTVIKTLKRLQEGGYITTAPHQPVLLTEEGKAMADFSQKRHQILLDFLIKLGVSNETAIVDVEGMEHHISEETLQAFQKYLES